MPASEQPRLRAGTRLNNDTVGGRWTSKQTPDVDNTPVGFGDGTLSGGVGEPNDWVKRVARISGLRAVFTRSVVTDTAGNKVVSITTNQEPPDVLLLARKGDVGYWSGERWNNNEQRSIWSADICRRMLQEGLVATGYESGADGICAVMAAACSTNRRHWVDGPHGLSAVVAQIRGLRLLQSMTGLSPDWKTTFGGHKMPYVDGLLDGCFHDTTLIYQKLTRPPWGTATPPGTPWGPQTVAGQATTIDGTDVFVGETGGLIWRALTETDITGMSPLKQGINSLRWSSLKSELVTAAALYDNIAEQQLTTGLFDGIDSDHRKYVRKNVRSAFVSQLPPEATQCRWTEDQQFRIRLFIKTVDSQKP